MAIKVLTHNQLSWINIDEVNEESLQYLRTNYSFHALDLEDVTAETHTPKLDVYKNYLFLVLQFPTFSEGRVVPFEIDIFVGRDYIVTVEQKRLKSLRDMFYRCMQNPKVKKKWMEQGVGYLLYSILEKMFENVQPILNILEHTLGELEESIYQEEGGKEVVRNLAHIRRDVLSFRRIVDPQRFIISNLGNSNREFIPENMTIYFDNVNDSIAKLWSIVTTYKDSIDSLHETHESLISFRRNETIKVLTVISVAIMPLTLLSGIYGMNIDRLPFAHSPAHVWAFYGILLAIIFISIVIWRKKGWL